MSFIENEGEKIELRALEYFHKGYNCAQSVFVAGADAHGFSEETALLLSSAFGAGIGRMRETCGAFSGLIMLVGMTEGNKTPDREDKEHIFALTQRLAGEFKEQFGSLKCKELLGLDENDERITTTLPQARTQEYYAERPCEACVAFCAKKAGSYLMKKLDNSKK